MAKKKRLTIKQLVATIERDLDLSELPELLFWLLVNLPQSEFKVFASDLYREEISSKFQKTDTVIVEKETYITFWKLMSECEKLREQQARLGRRATVQGSEFKDYVWTRRRIGRTEGEILFDARNRFPEKRIGLPFIKKIIREGDKFGFTRPCPFFRLPPIDGLLTQKCKE